jgi:DNA-binding MarR family transcriptional regulator
MAPTRELSLNEKLVLYGLVRFPEEHYTRIAKHLGIPQPTFSNIQRRLKQEQFYSLVGLPDLQALGIDLIAFMYGSYNPVSSDKDRRDLELAIRQRFPEIFFMVSGVHNILIFLASKDYSDLNLVLETIEKAYLEKGIMDKNAFTKALIPLQSSFMARWFDYANPLYSKFNLKETDVPPPPKLNPVVKETNTSIKMHQSDLRVLMYLLEHPEASDVKMAKDLDLSRTTVAKAKAELISAGYFKRCVTPDLKRIGFEVFVFSDVGFRADTTFQQRLGSTEWLLGKLPITLSLITNKQAITMYAFETFHVLQEMKRAALQEYVGKGYIEGDIKMIIYSSSEIIAQPEPNFVPILRKVLNLTLS